MLHFVRGVVHSQIRCTEFKSSKKSLDFMDFFRFSVFFWIFSDFFRIFFGVRGFKKKGFKYCIRGVVLSQIRYTDFKSSKKKSLDFSDFFEEVYEDFFRVNNPSILLLNLTKMAAAWSCNQWLLRSKVSRLLPLMQCCQLLAGKWRWKLRRCRLI